LKETENKHAVYIYRCSNVTLSIPSKITAVTMDHCKEGKSIETRATSLHAFMLFMLLVGLVVENVIASIDIISSKKVQLQILGILYLCLVKRVTF
jgi:Adenylate cyclase associated (CAP) C terminal